VKSKTARYFKISDMEMSILNRHTMIIMTATAIIMMRMWLISFGYLIIDENNDICSRNHSEKDKGKNGNDY